MGLRSCRNCGARWPRRIGETCPLCKSRWNGEMKTETRSDEFWNKDDASIPQPCRERDHGADPDCPAPEGACICPVRNASLKTIDKSFRPLSDLNRGLVVELNEDKRPL